MTRVSQMLKGGMLLLVVATLMVDGRLWAQKRRPGEPTSAETAANRLFAVAESKNEEALESAAKAVVAEGADAVEFLVRDPAKRTSAQLVWSLRCLSEIGTAEGGAICFQLSQHPDAEVRAQAVVTGTRLLKEEFVPILLTAFGDPDVVVKRRAIDGLIAHALGSLEAAILAVRALPEKDFWITGRGLQLIVNAPLSKEPESDKINAEVEKILPHLDSSTAEPLFDVLVRRSGPTLAPLLKKGLGLSNSAVVIVAVKKVGALRLTEHGDIVRGLAVTRDENVVIAAIDCLGALRELSSVPLLVELLEDTRDAVQRERLAVALRTITGRTFGYDVAQWRQFVADQRL